MKSLLEKAAAYFKKDKTALPVNENDQKKEDKMPIDNCPYCNGKKLNKFIEGRFFHRLQCGNCKVIFTIDKSTGEISKSEICV